MNERVLIEENQISGFYARTELLLSLEPNLIQKKTRKFRYFQRKLQLTIRRVHCQVNSTKLFSSVASEVERKLIWGKERTLAFSPCSVRFGAIGSIARMLLREPHVDVIMFNIWEDTEREGPARHGNYTCDFVHRWGNPVQLTISRRLSGCAVSLLEESC